MNAIRTIFSAAALTALASAASAATLTLSGGTAGTTSAADGNSALTRLFHAPVMSGQHGAQVGVSGPAKVTYTVLGGESGFRNSFSAAGSTLNDPDTFGWGGFGAITEYVSGGLLSFNFGINSGRRTVENGMNGAVVPSFFAAFSDTLQNVLYLFLDDGAGGDRDFDDMLVRVEIAPVPLPAGGLLLASGLGALALSRRRKTA